MRLRSVLARAALYAAGCTGAPALAATPWLPPPGGGEAAVGYINQTADRLFVGEREMPLPTDLEQWTVLLDLRYGLTDALALDFQGGYAESDFLTDPGLAPRGGEDGVTDTRLGLSWRVLDEFANPGAPSLALRAGLVLQGDYETGALPAIGDGADGAEFSVSLGKFFGALALAGELGYRARSQNVPDDTWLRTDWSYAITPQFAVRAGYLYNDSDGDLDIGGPGFTPARFPETEEDYDLYEVGVNLGWSGFNAGLGYGRKFDGLAGARNTAKSDIWSVSLGYGF